MSIKMLRETKLVKSITDVINIHSYSIWKPVLEITKKSSSFIFTVFGRVNDKTGCGFANMLTYCDVKILHFSDDFHR